MKSNICEQHKLPFTSYCKSEGCKKFLCETCSASHNEPEHLCSGKEQIYQIIQEKVRNSIAQFQTYKEDLNKVEIETKEIEEKHKPALENARVNVRNELKRIEQILIDFNADTTRNDIYLSFIRELKSNIERRKKETENINGKVKDMSIVEMQDLLENMAEVTTDDSETIKSISWTNTRILRSLSLSLII